MYYPSLCESIVVLVVDVDDDGDGDVVDENVVVDENFDDLQ